MMTTADTLATLDARTIARAARKQAARYGAHVREYMIQRGSVLLVEHWRQHM